MKKLTLSHLMSCLSSILLAVITPPILPIQERIEKGLYACFTAQSAEPLASLYTELEKQHTPLASYWMAYTKFYEAIYDLKTQKVDLAKNCIQQAITLLENTKNKTSEDYALLAYIQSFSLQFKTGMEAGKISGEVAANGQKALQLDSTNLRAWYIVGSHDFYLPATYGGGQKAESYLKKAIELSPQPVTNPWFPSWGKEEAYGLLIRFYLNKEKTAEARKYYEALKASYPESYLIVQYAEKFK